MYFFSDLALTLNEPEERVAPTDSRLRPDQRLMESGRWDEANVEKQRLEEKQRAVRRRREAEAVEALEEGEMLRDAGGQRPAVSRCGDAVRRPRRVWGVREGPRLDSGGWGERRTRREKQPLPPASPRPGKDYEGYIPLWFERKVDAVTGELICVYKGGYWEAKDKQDWSACPDIF